MTSPHSITVPVKFGALHNGQRMATIVPASLHYRVSDPYAVMISFHISAGDAMEWYVDRASMARGLGIPVAIGDVQFSPASNGTELYINFNSPGGKATLRLPTYEATAFLDRTYEMVPEGSESGRLGLDGLITQLLES